MSDAVLCSAFAAYIEAYHRADRKALVSLFDVQGSVSFAGPDVFRGHEQIEVVHERIGTFQFEVEAAFDAGDSTQFVEGSMFAIRDGERVREVPVPFSAIAECTGPLRDQFRSLRFYYDGRRVVEAVEIARLDP